MVYKCSVPGCSTRGRGIKYYCAPYTNKSRWEVWLRLCPFLQKYSRIQRDRIRFCTKHFIPEHINEKLKLTPNAIPVLNLESSYIQRNTDLKLEITPSSSVAEPYVFKAVRSSDLNENSSTDLSSELSSTVISIHALLSESNSTEPHTSPNVPDNREPLAICLTPFTSATTAVCYKQSSTPSLLSPNIPHNRESLATCIAPFTSTTTTVCNKQSSTPSLLSPNIPHNRESLATCIAPFTSTTTTVCNKQSSTPSLLSPNIPHNRESLAICIAPFTSTTTTVCNKQKSTLSLLSPNISHNTEHLPICITPSTSTTTALCNKQKFKTHSLVKRKLINRIRLNPNEATPRKQILRNSINILKSKLRLLQSRYKKLKTRFDLQAPKTKMFLKKYNIMSTFGKLLLDSQLRLTGNSLKGRRYTDAEKVFALSLYKLSPKCYGFLRKHLALPCKSRINSLLSNIPLRPGINDFIFQHLADAALDKTIIDRQCTLMFDEMTIKKHLNFNFFTGVIEGFEDLGSGKRTNNVADKALVFMLRGLFSPWKIPIAFYFARDGVKTFVLKNIIKEIVFAVFKSGFIVRATISDQGSANVAAIRSLISDSNAELLRTERCTNDICYKIGPNQLYHIYDVPHLLKCFRNNFQKKNLLIGNQRAKWEYIETLYKVDGFGGRARSTKLTEKHINPTSYDKMKVKFAAQVFSRQVATSLEVHMKSLLYLQDHDYLSLNSNIDNGLFTAKIIIFINNLFDSLNGFGHCGNKLKHALSCNSEHITFWNDAVKKLSSMRFDASSERERKPLSLKHFVHNIKTIRHMWSDLLRIDGVKFLSLRRLNQDPIENFFGQIRAHGNFSTNPNCSHFVSAFKTLLINNITTGKSLYTNCSEDDDKMLGTLKNLVSQQKYSSYTENLHSNETNFIESIPHENIFQHKAVPYIAGAVCRFLMSNLNCKDCDNCTKALLSQIESFHELIRLREYSSNIDRLYYPSSNFSRIVWQSIYIIDKMMPSICNVYVYSDLISTLQKNVDTSWYNCNIHKTSLIKAFWLYIIRVQVKQWCINFNNRINKIDLRPKDIEMETLIREKVTKGLSYRLGRRRST